MNSNTIETFYAVADDARKTIKDIYNGADAYVYIDVERTQELNKPRAIHENPTYRGNCPGERLCLTVVVRGTYDKNKFGNKAFHEGFLALLEKHSKFGPWEVPEDEWGHYIEPEPTDGSGRLMRFRIIIPTARTGFAS